MRQPWFLGSVVVLSLSACVDACPFIKVHRHYPWTECRTNLKAIYSAQRSHFFDHGSYSPHPAVIGFDPEAGNRYAYFLDDSGPLADRADGGVSVAATGIGVDRRRHPHWLTLADLPSPTGGEAPGLVLVPSRNPDSAASSGDVEFVAACAGVLKTGELDVWSISSMDRHTDEDDLVLAGDPHWETPQ